MSKCPICGLEEREPHVACSDPVISVERRASEWMSLMSESSHYFEILDAVDGPDGHRVRKLQAARLAMLVEEKIAAAMKRKANNEEV